MGKLMFGTGQFTDIWKIRGVCKADIMHVPPYFYADKLNASQRLKQSIYSKRWQCRINSEATSILDLTTKSKREE